MKLRPVAAALAIAGGATVLAFLAGIALDRLSNPIVASVAAAAVVVGLFTFRVADGLAAFGLVVLLSDTIQVWFGVDLRYVDEIAVGLMVVALVAHRQRIRLPRPGLREAGLALMFASGVASSLINAVPTDVWIPGLVLLAKGFTFFYVVLALRVTGAEVRRMTWTFFPVALVISAIGIVQWFAPDFAHAFLGVPYVNYQRGDLNVVTSVFTHPALYGWLTVFLALFLAARFAVLREWWALALATLLGASSVLSGRRTSLIGLVVALVAGVIHQLSIGRRTATMIAPALLLVVVVGSLTVPLLGDFYAENLEAIGEPPRRIAEVFSHKPRAKSIQHMAPRSALYFGSMAIGIERFPFGAGIGRFGSQMSREHYSPEYRRYGIHRVKGLREGHPIAVTDTFWPMILGETGVLGLLGMIVFIRVLGGQLWGLHRYPLEPAARAFVLGALLVYFESLVRSLSSAVYVAPPVSYFVHGTLALALGLAGGADEEARPEGETSADATTQVPDGDPAAS